MKVIPLIIIFLLAVTIIGFCQTQNSIIKDVRGEIFDDSAEIIVEANCDIDYIDYTLQDPPRVIIDPIGKVYSDLKDTIIFDSGPVKKVTVIKGKPEEGSTGNFYPLDLISIELVSPLAYTVKKEIQKEALIVDIGKKKEVDVSKLIPETPAAEEALSEEGPATEALPVPEAETLPAQASSPPLAPEPQAKPETAEVIPLTIPEKKAEAATAMPLNEPIKMVYKIGQGDTLDISVWQHSELDKKVVVRPDGYISFPLVGDITAAGQTPPQLASNVKENLSRLIKDPQVTVIVLGFGSKNIFVLGEVIKAGAYPYRGGVNVLDAISEAGGWKSSAVLNSVMVVRKAFTEAPEAHRLNIYALVKNGDFSQNIALEPGDIIYVPKSFIANIGSFIENLKISIGAYVTEGTHVFN